MQALTATALLIAAALLPSERAHAIDYPYCLKYVDGWSGMIERCDFTSMAQCQMSASGLNGSCGPNWRLQFNAEPAPARPHRRPRQPLD